MWKLLKGFCLLGNWLNANDRCEAAVTAWILERIKFVREFMY